MSGPGQSHPGVHVGAGPAAAGGITQEELDTQLSPFAAQMNGFRLSPETGKAIPDGDDLVPTSVFAEHLKGNAIGIYDGTIWRPRTSAAISYALAGRTAALPFDLFYHWTGAALTLEPVDWATATTRATAIVRQDGVWVKSGDALRRWAGSCLARSATTYEWRPFGFGSDGPLTFDLFNAENRVRFSWRLRDTADHTYTTNTWRQWRGSTNWQIDVLAGTHEEALNCTFQATTANSSSSAVGRQVGLGWDSTTQHGPRGSAGESANLGPGREVNASCNLSSQIDLGAHFIAMLQKSVNSNTTTWLGGGDTADAVPQMAGDWTC